MAATPSVAPCHQWTGGRKQAPDLIGKGFLQQVISLTHTMGASAGLHDQLSCLMCLPKSKFIDSTDMFFSPFAIRLLMRVLCNRTNRSRC